MRRRLTRRHYDNNEQLTTGAVNDLTDAVDEQTMTMKAIAVHLSRVIAAVSNNTLPATSGFTLDQLDKTIDDIEKCEHEEYKARRKKFTDDMNERKAKGLPRNV